MNRNGCFNQRSAGATRLQWWVGNRTQAGTSSYQDTRTAGRQVLSVRTCPLPCPVSRLAGSQAPPARVPTHSILTHPPSLACFTPRNSPRTSLSQCATNLASASCFPNRASSQPQVPCDASCSTCSFPCPRSWPRPWRKNTSHSVLVTCAESTPLVQLLTLHRRVGVQKSAALRVHCLCDFSYPSHTT
jgi:hypothetical protein